MPPELPPRNLQEELNQLIISKKNTEHECREYLKYVRYILVKDTVLKEEYIETEYRGHTGDSDYAISCTIIDESGVKQNKAYLWELKAPQCFLFDRETNNRLMPSNDLIKAENQLLHYHDECKGNTRFREDFNITNPDNVCFGGIIIGSNATNVHGDYNHEKKTKLYAKALHVRKLYFYQAHGIRLLTWDYVLNQLPKPKPKIHVDHVKPQGQIDVQSFEGTVQYVELVKLLETLRGEKL